MEISLVTATSSAPWRFVDDAQRGCGDSLTSQFVEFNRRFSPFYVDLVFLNALDPTFSDFKGINTGKNLAWRSKFLYALGEIDRIANCRIVFPQGAAHVANDRLA